MTFSFNILWLSKDDEACYHQGTSFYFHTGIKKIIYLCGHDIQYDLVSWLRMRAKFQLN